MRLAFFISAVLHSTLYHTLAIRLIHQREFFIPHLWINHTQHVIDRAAESGISSNRAASFSIAYYNWR